MSKVDLYDLELMIENIYARVKRAQEIFIKIIDINTTPIKLEDYFNENILDMDIYEFCISTKVKFIDGNLIITIDPISNLHRTRTLILKKALFDCKDEELKDFIFDEIKMLVHNKIMELKFKIETENNDLKSLYKIYSQYDNK